MTNATDLLNEMDNATSGGSSLNDLLSEVENEDTTPSWQPEEPASIAGTLVKTASTASDFHDRPVPVWTIKQENGESIRIAGFRSVLEREMNEAAPATGDLIAVKYFGRMLKKNAKPGSKQNTDYFQKYRVITRHP
jgi:hypothetical protein